MSQSVSLDEEISSGTMKLRLFFSTYAWPFTHITARRLAGWLVHVLCAQTEPQR
jgi:hypothetical protein